MLKREVEGGTESEDRGCGARAVGRGGKRGEVRDKERKREVRGPDWGGFILQ